MGESFFNNANSQITTQNTQNSHHKQIERLQIDQKPQTPVINQNVNNTFNMNSSQCSTYQNQCQSSNVKVEKDIEKTTKKGGKRFVCCYCSWSGNDNWGLKRHLNTHTKPFVCSLCDYKAARSERLATHVFKVHNKKVCIKCNYLAETQNEYNAHLNNAQ